MATPKRVACSHTPYHPTRVRLVVAFLIQVMATIALIASPLRALASEGEAQDKNAPPVPAKFVEHADQWAGSTTAGVGETVRYRIESTLPSDIHEYEGYSLWLCDHVDESLAYVSGSVRPRLVHADGTEEDVDLTVTVEGQDLRVGSDDLLGTMPDLRPDDTIAVEYDCRVLPGASQGFHDSNNNSLHLRYGDDPSSQGSGSTSVSKVSRVYSFEIDLLKVGKGESAGLAGARFVMRDARGLYRTARGTWTKDQADAEVVATDADGVARFAGVGEGSYSFIETKAPKGYEKSAKPLEVTLVATGLESAARTLSASADGGTVSAVDPTSGVATIRVENPKSEGEPSDPSDSEKPDPPSKDDPKDPDPREDEGEGKGDPKEPDPSEDENENEDKNEGDSKKPNTPEDEGEGDPKKPDVPGDDGDPKKPTPPGPTKPDPPEDEGEPKKPSAEDADDGAGSGSDTTDTSSSAETQDTSSAGASKSQVSTTTASSSTSVRTSSGGSVPLMSDQPLAFGGAAVAIGTVSLLVGAALRRRRRSGDG